MIVVRNVFKLKFGKSKDAVAAFQKGIGHMQKVGPAGFSARMLTDLVSSFYTVVLELTFPSLAEYENTGKKMMASDEWKAWYETVIPFVESGHREIFSIVE
jgi:hypothetical protein